VLVYIQTYNDVCIHSCRDRQRSVLENGRELDLRNRETSRAGTDGRGEGGNCEDTDVAGRGPVAQETLRYQRDRSHDIRGFFLGFLRLGHDEQGTKLN